MAGLEQNLSTLMDDPACADGNLVECILSEQGELKKKVAAFADLSLEVKRKHLHESGWGPADGSCCLHSLSDLMGEKVQLFHY